MLQSGPHDDLGIHCLYFQDDADACASEVHPRTQAIERMLQAKTLDPQA
jgi:hypothetical protein